MTFELSSVFCFDLCREFVTRTSDTNDHRFERKMTKNLKWDFDCKHCKVCKKGLDVNTLISFILLMG